MISSAGKIKRRKSKGKKKNRSENSVKSVKGPSFSGILPL